MSAIVVPTPLTDAIRDEFRGDTDGLCRALIAHSNALERDLATAQNQVAQLQATLEGFSWFPDSSPKDATEPKTIVPTAILAGLQADLAAAQGEAESNAKMRAYWPERAEKAESRTTAIMGELNAVNQHFKIVSASNRDMAQLIEEQRAELAALREDKARLDWLMNWNVTGHPFKTRDALDAARAKEGGA